jgi:hypothetical protein
VIVTVATRAIAARAAPADGTTTTVKSATVSANAHASTQERDPAKPEEGETEEELLGTKPGVEDIEIPLGR